MAVVLLAGAVLMARSLWQLQQIDLGFDPAGVLTMRLALPETQYDTPERVAGFYERLLQGVRATPGVSRAGLVRVLPLAAPIGDWGMRIEGYTPPPGVRTPGEWQVVSDGALAALGETIVEGRDLTSADTIGHPDVALVNQAMARKYWPGRSAIGRRFRMGSSTERPWVTIVGVVGNVTHNGITAEVKPKFYRPAGQLHRSTGNPPRNMTLVVRTAGEPLALAAPLRAHIRQLNPTLPVAAVRTMDDVVSTSIATPRLTGRVLGLFALLATLLAGVGIYGVLSYVVSQRQQELGIRLAVGAGRAHVLFLVLKSGLVLAGTGVIVGLGIARAATRLLAPLLHDVAPYDPLTYAVVPSVLVAVAAFASLVPAWRASRVDPLRALRAP